KNRRKASPSVRRQLAALTKSTAEKRMPCSSTSTSPGSKRPRHSGSLSASRAAIEPAKTMVNGSSGLGNPGWASSTRQPVSANRRAPASAIRRVSGSTGDRKSAVEGNKRERRRRRRPEQQHRKLQPP